MTHRLSSFLFPLLLAMALREAHGQNLQITSQVGSVVTPVTSGGAITVPSDGVGRAASALITLRNAGTTSLSLNQISISGSADFTLSGLPAFPQTLAAGASVAVQLQYQATSTARTQATAQIQTTEGSAAQTYAFQALGTAPDLAVSYSLASDGISRTLDSAGQVSFGAVDLQSSLAANFVVTNRGSGSGQFLAASASPYPDFQVAGLPGLPALLGPGDTARFQVIFTARVIGRSSGALTITLSGGRTIGAFLDGVGAASDFRISYMLPANQNVLPLTDGGQLAFLPTSINSTSTASVYVENRGAGGGTINGVTLSGTGFELTALPPFPLTVAAGKTASFGVRFKPLSSGHYTGTLRIDLKDHVVTVVLDGSTALPDYYFSYSDSTLNNNTPLTDGSLMTFQPASVGGTTGLKVTVENRGTGAGVLNAVTVGGSGFELAGLPLLPLTVDAGAKVSFVVNFRPLSVGHFIGTLKIDLKDRVIAVGLDAQTAAPDFRFSYNDPRVTNNVPFSDGAQLIFQPTSVNSSGLIKILVENRGKGSGILNGVSLSGTGFELAGLPILPLTIDAGASATFNVLFKPLSSGHYSGALRIDLKDRVVAVSLDAVTAAANFYLSYVDPLLNNTISVSPGSVVPLPDTLTSSKTDVTLVLENRGAGGGVVSNITLSGDAAFQLLQLPVLPFTLDASKNLRFVVRFSPADRQIYAGTLQITLADQTVLAVRLEGSGIGPAFTYALVGTDSTTPIVPNANIAFPDTELNQNSNLVLRVSNTGTAEGKLTTLLISGAAFGVSDAPLPPITLQPGNSIQFTLTFRPTQIDLANGRVRIGDDAFTLSGKGIGAKWEYSFATGQSTTTLDPGGVVLLGSTAVGEQSSAQFTIINRGNKAAPVFSLILGAQTGGSSTAGATQPFLMDALPALPLNLAPGASLSFSIRFVPDNLGTLTGSLIVNNVPFAVVGNGLAPQRVPRFSFTGASASQTPLQQPGLGLTLAEPYPLPLQGTLTMDFVSEVFSGNPAVQFATGGRTARFTIPANSTEAVFDNSAKNVRFQTGTVAGNIVVVPTFATQAGLDITPASLTVFTATVARSAPQIIDAKIVNRTAGAFQLSITGYSTTRSLKQLTLDLTARPGVQFSNAHLTVDLQSASLLWFQSADSQAYGSLFMITLPVTVQGNGNSTEDRVSKLSSVAASASNEVGTSNALSVPIL